MSDHEPIRRGDAKRLCREVRCDHCGVYADPENFGLDCCQRPIWGRHRDNEEIEQAISDLPAVDPLTDPRVAALVEAVRLFVEYHEMVDDDGVEMMLAYAAAIEASRAALAALKGEGE